MMTFERHRRMRQNEAMRSLAAETKLDSSHFMMPFFVIEGENKEEPIEMMPGVSRYTVDRLMRQIERAVSCGVRSVLLFGVLSEEEKDACGSGAWNPNGSVQNALRAIKRNFPDIIAAADICLCEYTDHGHCGVVADGNILNDETLPLLCKAAVSCAQAGADIVAPSDMMDGHVCAIREALDQAGFTHTVIMAYSAKYASAFYGPFRDAAGSAPGFGDRRTYQMDYRNRKEAIAEVMSDLKEGADIVMVKPGLAYLDILREVRECVNCPVAVYNVSGEYSMVKAAAQNGWMDEKKAVLELLTAMRRAGADIIITYFAIDAARWLKEES